MSVFGRLMKDTAIYGLSSILARMLNFFMLPLYTRKLTEGDFGTYSDIFAYIALLQVVLVFGMETGFFRFASRNDRDPDKAFQTIAGFLLVTSSVFFVAMCVFSSDIARTMGYYPVAVILTAGILAVDSYASVMFARLRYERKAMKFAVIRSVKIVAEVAFNLIFLLTLPAYFESHPHSVLLNVFTPQISYVYVLAAVFCSCLIPILFFARDILKTPLKISKTYLNEIFIYSFPLMLAGLQGVANDFADRILFRFLAPRTETTWNEQLGLFSANARLAVIMTLFVQMFRYAAEPYFFSSAAKEDIRPTYARVTKYFTVFCVVIFLFTALYADVFKLILGEGFRQGIFILPIMLTANIFSGINQNLSIWYKLASRTKTAVLITFCGLVTTLAVNVIFMPRYGYVAAAWGHPASYSVMLLVSWNLSKKYYKIPYEWGKIIFYIAFGLFLYAASRVVPEKSPATGLILNTVLLSIFVASAVRIERIDPKAQMQRLIKIVRTKK